MGRVGLDLVGLTHSQKLPVFWCFFGGFNNKVIFKNSLDSTRITQHLQGWYALRNRWMVRWVIAPTFGDPQESQGSKKLSDESLEQESIHQMVTRMIPITGCCCITSWIELWLRMTEIGLCRICHRWHVYCQTGPASRHVTSWHGWPYLVKPWILRPMHFMWPCMNKWHRSPGSTRSTLLHERINPKDWQVSFVGDAGFLPFFRVVSSDYGKPRSPLNFWEISGWGKA